LLARRPPLRSAVKAMPFEALHKISDPDVRALPQS